MKLNIIPLSQNNPEWKRQKLGDSSNLIGDYGCLLVSLTMTLNHYKKSFTVSGLNSVCQKIGAFNGAYISWEPFAKHFEFDFEWIKCADTPAPVDLIKQRIDQGHPTIIKVDADKVKPDVQAHFCLVVGYTEKDLIINDPWTGEEYFLTAKYPHVNNAWNKPEYIIYGLRVLTPQGGSGEATGDNLSGCLKAHVEAVKWANDEKAKKEVAEKEVERLNRELESSNSILKDLKIQDKEKGEKIKKLEVEWANKQSEFVTANQEKESLAAQLTKYRGLYEKALAKTAEKLTTKELVELLIKRLFGK